MLVVFPSHIAINLKVTVSRKAHFNAAHRLHNPNWDDARNAEIFDKCNYPNFHGHNYHLTVSIRGEIDPDTGFVMDMKRLKELIKIHVEDHYDHRNLNLDTPEFQKLNPTAENIAAVIWQRLRQYIDEKHDLKITLYETERNFVECEG